MSCIKSVVYFHVFLWCAVATGANRRSCVCGPVMAPISTQGPTSHVSVNQGTDNPEVNALSRQVNLPDTRTLLEESLETQSQAVSSHSSDPAVDAFSAFSAFSVADDGVLEALLEAITDFHADGAKTVVEDEHLTGTSHEPSTSEYDTTMQEYLDYVSAYKWDMPSIGAAAVSDLEAATAPSSSKRQRVDESLSADPSFVGAPSDRLIDPEEVVSSASDAPEESDESFMESTEPYDEAREPYEESVESHQETGDSFDSQVSVPADSSRNCRSQSYVPVRSAKATEGRVAGTRRRDWSAYAPAEDAAIGAIVGLSELSEPLDPQLHIGEVVRKRGLSGVRKRAEFLLNSQGRYTRCGRKNLRPGYRRDELAILRRWSVNRGPTNEELDLLLNRHTLGSIEGKLERLRRK